MLGHDLVIILAMTFPMFIFTIFVGIKLSDYLEKKYGINEFQKRSVLLGATFLSALFLSTLLYYV